MTAPPTPPVLWLRDANELMKPPSRFSILWPAYEYTVLVFGHSPRETGLDPFERAVLGASAAGVVSIVEQSEILDLNPGFVAHLHERLMERGFLDDYSTPRQEHGAMADEDEILTAARIYQDPWSGSLWPRYVADDRRRTVPLSTDAGRLRVIIGTTGAPIELRSLYLNRSLPTRTAPSSDDAVRVFSEWSRLQRSHRLRGATLPDKPAARVLPDSLTTVLLCCPSSRGRPGRPQVYDPFGGPEWSPFVRALAGHAEEYSVLRSWLFAPPENDEAVRTDQSDADHLAGFPPDFGNKAQQLRAILDAIDTGRGWNEQALLELESVGHQALDLLWPIGTQPPQELISSPTLNQTLLGKIALTVGFDTADMPLVDDLGSLVAGERGSLRDRCAALLLLFPADQRGPLHRLAESVPALFSNLVSNGHSNALLVDGLREVVQALVSVAAWASDDATLTGGR